MTLGSTSAFSRLPSFSASANTRDTKAETRRIITSWSWNCSSTSRHKGVGSSSFSSVQVNIITHEPPHTVRTIFCQLSFCRFRRQALRARNIEVVQRIIHGICPPLFHNVAGLDHGTAHTGDTSYIVHIRAGYTWKTCVTCQGEIDATVCSYICDSIVDGSLTRSCRF